MNRFFKENKPAMLIRYAVLGLLFIYISFNGYMHQQYEVKYPSVDAICPFGGIESLFSIIFEGKFLNRVQSSSFVLLGITVLLIIITGRSFCGWICPLGTIQGIMAGLGRKLFGRKTSGPELKDGKIRWLRYLMLVVFTIGAWYGGKLLIRPYDPWVAWMHLSEFGHAIEEFPIGMVVLLALVLVSLFIPRSFCRYLCPMGAFLSLINKFSVNKIKRQAETCLDCNLCNKECPVGLEVSKMEIVDKQECISCGECVSVCPAPKTLKFQIAGKWRLSSFSLGVIVLVIFFGTLTTATLTNVYSSSPPSIEEYKASGDLKPETIKGYMTLSEVAYMFNLNLTDLYNEIDVDPNIVPANTKSKEIGDIINRKFDTDVVRLAVGTLLNIPHNQIQRSCSSDGSNKHFIYGTMTLKEVSDQFKIPLETLYSELGLSQEEIPPDTPCRELKNLVSPDFHTSKVREAVMKILD